MALKLSARADIIAQSEIRIMSVECERVGGVNLSQGVCDTEIPLPVRRAAQEAIESGVNTYTRLEGLIELRKAIADKLELRLPRSLESRRRGDPVRAVLWLSFEHPAGDVGGSDLRDP